MEHVCTRNYNPAAGSCRRRLGCAAVPAGSWSRSTTLVKLIIARLKFTPMTHELELMLPCITAARSCCHCMLPLCCCHWLPLLPLPLYEEDGPPPPRAPRTCACSVAGCIMS